MSDLSQYANGINELCNVVNERALYAAREEIGGLNLSIGSITIKMGLICDDFPREIPRKNYLVTRLLNGLTFDGGEHSQSSGNGHHKHTLPKLKPGDRVLVAWVGTKAVVIDVVT